MVPEHLAFPAMDAVVAAHRTKGAHCDRWNLLDKAAVERGAAFTHVGTFEEILRQITVREYPSCQQLFLELGWASHLPVVEAWHIPRFVGTDEDTLLYLVHTFGKVRMSDSELSERMVNKFPSVLQRVATYLMLKSAVECECKERNKKVERRRKLAASIRIRNGQVYINDLSWLVHNLLRVIDKSINSRVDVRLARCTCGTTKYMEAAIALLKALERFGLLHKIPRKFLNVFRPFLPGLARHEGALHRDFGRAVRRVLRKLKRRKK